MGSVPRSRQLDQWNEQLNHIDSLGTRTYGSRCSALAFADAPQLHLRSVPVFAFPARLGHGDRPLLQPIPVPGSAGRTSSGLVLRGSGVSYMNGLGVYTLHTKYTIVKRGGSVIYPV